MTATYRGIPIKCIEHDHKRDEYHLIDAEGAIIETLPRSSFLSFPQLRRLPHGRHRRAGKAVYRGSVGQPGYTYTPGTFISFTAWATPFFPDDKPDRPIENAGIRTGEIVALRGWRICDGRLFSIHRYECEWLPDRPMTGDVRQEYGVHAFKVRDDLLTYIGERHLLESMGWIAARFDYDQYGPRRDPFVIGTVALWGEVIEHERGYRAEFAKIQSLDEVVCAQGDAPALLAALRDRFGLQAKTNDATA